jgi:hypothetical protein
MANDSKATRPPALLFTLLCTLLLATLALYSAEDLSFSLPFTDHFGDRNAVGFLVGSVLGTATLGAFLIQDNARRSTMRYSDWSFLSPRVIAPYITGVTWALGVLHMFFWAKDLTRA